MYLASLVCKVAELICCLEEFRGSKELQQLFESCCNVEQSSQFILRQHEPVCLMGGGALCHALCQSNSAWADGGVMLKNAHTSIVLSVNWVGHLIGSRLFL